MLNMPQFPPDQIEGMRRCFTMYVKLPKNRWDEIRKAETDGEVFDRLAEEYIENEWGGDPHGKIDADLAEAMRGLN